MLIKTSPEVLQRWGRIVTAWNIYFQVNEMVQYEIPVNHEPELCQAIIEVMVHGPRGPLDRSYPCMKEVNIEI